MPRLEDGILEIPGVEVVRESEGMQPEMTYIRRQHATVRIIFPYNQYFKYMQTRRATKGVVTG